MTMTLRSNATFLPLLLTMIGLGCAAEPVEADDEVGDTGTDTATETATDDESSESSDESTVTSDTDESTDTDDTTESTDDTTESTDDTTDDDTTDDTTETTDTGDPTEELACGSVAGCVDACAGDVQCAQTCIDAASMTGASEYDAIAQCVVESGCLDQPCVEQMCAAELFACISGEQTCSETAACIDACADDDVCEGNCFFEATPLAQSQGQGLQNCIVENACADDLCIVANCTPELQGCLGGMSDELPCPLVAQCVFDCGNDLVCADACYISASPSALAEVPPMLECAEMESCGEYECVAVVCPDEYLACNWGDATCSELATCISGCAEAELCQYVCLTEADSMAGIAYGNLVECIAAHECVDDPCVAENCGDQVLACGI